MTACAIFSFRRRTALLTLLLCLALPFAATAAPRAPAEDDSAPAAEIDSAKRAAARAAIKAGATPIAVEHDGTDTLGSRLSFQIKEIFNSGTLFDLTDATMPKLVLMISTAQEFPSRPGVGSVYSVVWLYSERPTVLSNYLAHESGVITPDDLSDLAERIAARTAGIAAKHAYVFGKR